MNKPHRYRMFDGDLWCATVGCPREGVLVVALANVSTFTLPEVLERTFKHAAETEVPRVLYPSDFNVTATLDTRFDVEVPPCRPVRWWYPAMQLVTLALAVVAVVLLVRGAR